MTLGSKPNVGKYSRSKKTIKHMVGIRVVLGAMHQYNFIVGIRDEHQLGILISNVVTPMKVGIKVKLSALSPLSLP